MSSTERLDHLPLVDDQRFALRNIAFGALVVMLLALALATMSVISSIAYHELAYGHTGPILLNALVGLLAGLLYAVPSLVHKSYTIDGLLGAGRQPGRMFLAWNTAILSLGLLAFLTKTTDLFSRGWLIVFYAGGLLTVLAVEALVAVGLRSGLSSGRILPRRIMLIGTEAEVQEFSDRFTGSAGDGDRVGVRVVALAILPDETVAAPQAPAAAFQAALAQGVAKARMLLPDDIVILRAWTDSSSISAVFEAFAVLPVTIRLDGGAMLARYSDARISKVGPAATLALTEPPLSALQVVGKRAFDIVVGGLALLLLSPVLLGVAAVLKLTGSGSVLFRQRRLGFNQREFMICKFCSMTAGDDGDEIPQAHAGDPRITPVGAFIRRWNIDELPQLFNVLRGEMSLVGPRPHAVAHDRDFEQRIVNYPRRLNMKPGITGWAQVNGFRGQTDTDDKMAKRVEYDLFYIDHWSIGFDLYILILTIISPAAYRNAR